MVAMNTPPVSNSVRSPEFAGDSMGSAVVSGCPFTVLARSTSPRPEIEVFVVPAGNLPTMAFIPRWESAVGKPVISTNQAALWAMLQIMGIDEKLPGLGRLLEEMPAM